MEDAQTLLQQGSEAALKAIRADERRDYDEAGELYSMAARCMWRALALIPHFNRSHDLQVCPFVVCLC